MERSHKQGCVSISKASSPIESSPLQNSLAFSLSLGLDSISSWSGLTEIGKGQEVKGNARSNENQQDPNNQGMNDKKD